MKIYRIITKTILRLHNFCYRLTSVFCKKTEQGLHPKHRLMNYHKFFIDNINSGDTVLDLGCGNGALSFDIAKKAIKVVGIDLNERNIEFAKERFSAPNLEYIIGDARENLPDRRFDAIILSNVLEHIEDRVEFLKKIKKIAPKILIRVPMINRDWITLYKKELGVEWRLDKTHDIEYTLESFKNELNQADLFIKKHSIQFGEIWAVII